MSMTPMKDNNAGPPWWDLPLAVAMILVALAVVILFIMNFTGPTTNIIP